MQASTPPSRDPTAKVVMGQVIFVSGAVGALLTLGNVLVSGWSALPATLPWLGWVFIACFVLSGVLQVWRRDKADADAAGGYLLRYALSRDFMSDDSFRRVAQEVAQERPDPWQVDVAYAFGTAGALTLGAVLFGGVFLSVLGVLLLVGFVALCGIMYVSGMRFRKFERETNELARRTEELKRKRRSEELESSEVAPDGWDGMYCTNCGHRLPLSARFCSRCGTGTDSTVA